MRPLFQAQTLSPEAIAALRKDCVPANLHDVSGKVFDDKLYSLYTTATNIQDNDIRVQIIATSLVKHTAGNMVEGYWCGIGINSEVVTAATAVYAGWGVPDETEFPAHMPDPVAPDGEQVTGDSTYATFYWNAGNASKYENKGYVLLVLPVDDGDVHIHYTVDFAAVNRLESVQLDPVKWGGITVASLQSNYLFGINLTDPQGNPLPESLFVHYINAAVQWWQNVLDIVIEETPVAEEQHDYIRNDYRNWGFLMTDKKPVKQVTGLRLMYGDRPSVEIPLDWIQLNKLTGQITLFPQSGSASQLIIGQTGLLYGFQSHWDYAPAMWHVDYVAGMDESDPTMPVDLLNEGIAKRAAMGILNVWGDLIIGAGIASQSVSLDGISQSIGTTQSAMFGGASARVNEYRDDIDKAILPALRQKFGGIPMVVI